MAKRDFDAIDAEAERQANALKRQAPKPKVIGWRIRQARRTNDAGNRMQQTRIEKRYVI